MRPPSYYTSLANSNSVNSSSSSSRNSSQQLRSSFSSPSTSSYVTRSHLPFVPNSTLVAHCFTGVGSSTKPYGQSSASSLSPNYSHSSSGYSSSYYSRPQSTKRHTNPYLSSRTSSSLTTNSSSLSYLPPRSAYLSSAASRTSSTRNATTSSYRMPTTSSSYYTPIRLRERPLLTQISRQLETKTANSNRISPRVHSVRKEDEHPAKEPVAGGKGQTSTEGKEEEEENWSSDVARNISRNKYLIKFREIDKRPSISPIQATAGVEVELEPQIEKLQSIQPEAEEKQQLAEEGKQSGELEAVKGAEKTKPVEKTEEMKLLINETDSLSKELKIERSVETTDNEDIKPEECLDCDKIVEKDNVDEIVAEKKAPKEKRNIKLKIKNLNATSSEKKNVKETTKAKKASSKVTAEVESVGDSLPIKTKVKRPVKGKINEQKVLTKSDDTSSKNVEQNSGEEAESATKSIERKVLAPKQPQTQDSFNLNQSNESSSIEQKTTNSSSGISANKRIRFREYHCDDFNFLTVLGHGGWGFVILAELKEHDACFAVKCIKKITIVEDDDFDSIMIERKVLGLGNIHPFICKLFCTFETDGYLFFVMEFCAGGDLMFHVQKEGKFTESRCRFYAAEIICAIRFLHNKHIIYRDLKLDNILLDSKGHIRLVDFGMCQCRTYREEMLPSNFCGTPEYISPEIIKGVPYNHSVDWWSFGVLLYEMAVGKMPFRGNDENELLWNVCYEQIHYPMFLTKELTTLLQLLLEREPNKRMGMSTCKSGDIKDQPWFRGVDWLAIEELRVKPPFVPEVSSNRDVRNFDADFTESKAELSPVDQATLSKIDQTQFQAFPYTNPNISFFDSIAN